MWKFIIPAALLAVLSIPVATLLTRHLLQQKKAREHLQDLLNREVFDFAVFDIRSLEEYRRSHLPGAVHFPLEDISYLPLEDMFLHLFISGDNRRDRSRAVNYLSDNGYFNVYNLGPLRRWKHVREEGFVMGIEEFAQIHDHRKKNESI